MQVDNRYKSNLIHSQLKWVVCGLSSTKRLEYVNKAVGQHRTSSKFCAAGFIVKAYLT